MLLEQIFSNLIFLALHLDSQNMFPPTLTSQEEKYYLERLRDGDKKAKDILIERNLRLVAHIIKKYYSVNTENEELISVGTIGLVKAVNSYDMCKGVRLATYAARCIENEILMYFRNQKKSALDMSFDEPIETDSEGNPMTLMDIIAQDDTIIDEISLKINTSKLIKYISEIKDPREKNIIIMRYGLDGNEPKPQNVIAAMYGISRSYVSRLETKALKALRKRFENE